ncbi:hypothetical protein [Pendulispora albinea]|uniref:Uncharacterized protein n=1 Tax=Pendulispora albinea TaxID=2741071 RepID=A0ABZ2LV77_9BACT
MSPTTERATNAHSGPRPYPSADTADRGEEDSLERQVIESFPFDFAESSEGPTSTGPEDVARTDRTDGEVEAEIPTAPSTDDDRESVGHLP